MSTRLRSRDVNELVEAVSQLEADLAGLQAHQTRLQSEGNYIEAEAVRVTVEEIKAKLVREKGELLTAQQKKQVEELDQAQMSDFQHFNQTWDARLRTKSDLAEDAVNDMKETNEKALLELEAELNSHPVTCKPSSTLIQLKEREKQAAKQKNYLEAQACKQRFEELQAQERLEAQRKHAVQVTSKLNLARKKLNTELNTLQQRLTQEFNELLTIRGMETEELLKKYQNSKKELLLAQGMERNQRQSGGKGTDKGRKVARLFDQSRQNTSREELKTPIES